MSAAILQNVIVLQQDDCYQAFTDFSHELLHESKNASETIQAAINLFENYGGQVILGRGIFFLEKEIHLVDHLWLRGSGRSTRLLVPPKNPHGVGINCQGLSGVTISDLAVEAAQQENSLAGIVIDNSGDCQVRHVFVQGFGSYGIWLRNNTFLCELNSCKAADNRKANIFLDNLAQAGRVGDFVPNLVANCTTYGGGTGFECHRAIVVNLVGCVSFQPGKYAFHVRDVSNSVLISGCRSFQVEKDAVVIEKTEEINISSNIFCWHRGTGIVLRDVSWGAINGNEVIDSGVRAHDGSLMDGIRLLEGSEGIQIVGNTVFNWGDQTQMRVGIYEDQSCRNNLIAQNNINYFTEAAVVSKGTGTHIGDYVAEGTTAYHNMEFPPYPDFNREKLEQFIQSSKIIWPPAE